MGYPLWGRWPRKRVPGRPHVRRRLNLYVILRIHSFARHDSNVYLR